MRLATRYLTHVFVLVLVIGAMSQPLAHALGGSAAGLVISGSAASNDLRLGLVEPAVMLKPILPTRPGSGRWQTVDYSVQEGDTLWAIAARFDLSLGTLKWSNSLSDVDSLSLGQKLRIPPEDGILVTLSQPAKVADLAAKYHAQAQDIVRANRLEAAMAPAGVELFLPGAYLDEQVIRPAEVAASDTGSSQSYAAPSGSFIWPVSGYITQYFTPYHNGLDIGAPWGAPMWASDSGTVVHAGWGWYGIYVEIDHGNGYHTIYGHMSSVAVHMGEWVSQGHYIGAIGCTGHCTGPHVHFMVVYDGVPQNPLLYL